MNCVKMGSMPSMVPVMWNPHTNEAKVGRQKKFKTAWRPKSVVTVKDMLSLDASTPIPQDVEKAMSHVMAIKMSRPSLANHSIELKASGPQLLTLTPIRVAKKESQSATKADDFE